MNGDDLRRILSRNIKLLRNRRSFSQIELAEKADISIPFLSNIERGNKWPYPDTLVKLAGALDVKVHQLFQENTPPKTEGTGDTLIQFRKDLAVSLHKTVLSAIDSSLNTIGDSYLEGTRKDKK